MNWNSAFVYRQDSSNEFFVGCDFALDWSPDESTGSCEMPTKGQRLIGIPEAVGMGAFQVVHWRKAKRLVRKGSAFVPSIKWDTAL